MDTLVALYPTLKALWAVWFVLVFLGMLAFVLRPSKRRHYERAGEIPLRDDPPPGGGA
jgi:cytochrome c oxidase cbb3-type subunit 4